MGVHWAGRVERKKARRYGFSKGIHSWRCRRGNRLDGRWHTADRMKGVASWFDFFLKMSMQFRCFGRAVLKVRAVCGGPPWLVRSRHACCYRYFVLAGLCGGVQLVGGLLTVASLTFNCWHMRRWYSNQGSQRMQPARSPLPR